MPKLNLRRAVNVGNALRVAALVIGLAAVVVAVFLWRKQVRYEGAYRYGCDIPAFERVTDACLESVQVPVNRQFTVVTSAGEVVGKWTTRPVAADEMVHQSQLTASEPDRFRFHASGQELPEETWGYFIPVASEALGQVKPGQLLTLAMVDPLTEQTIVIMDKVYILEQGSGGIYVGATWEQVGAMEGLKTEMRTDDEEDALRPWLVWTITQGANPDLPSLAVFRTDLTADALAPASTGD